MSSGYVGYEGENAYDAEIEMLLAASAF